MPETMRGGVRKCTRIGGGGRFVRAEMQIQAALRGRARQGEGAVTTYRSTSLRWTVFEPPQRAGIVTVCAEECEVATGVGKRVRKPAGEEDDGVEAVRGSAGEEEAIKGLPRVSTRKRRSGRSR